MPLPGVKRAAGDKRTGIFTTGVVSTDA